MASAHAKLKQSATDSRHAMNFRPTQCDGVVLRTPLLPIDTFVGWADEATAAAASAEGGDVERALLCDRQRLRARLEAIVRRSEVLEALHLAAPDVAQGIDAWAVDPDSKRGGALERSLVRYVTRMCTRATPFGLFAGCTVGTVGSRTAAELAPTASYRRSVDIDADAIHAMAARLLRDPKAWAGHLLFTNTTVAEIAGGFHYVEWRDGEHGRSYDLVRLPGTDYLRAVIKVARQGACVAQLVAALRGHIPDLDTHEAWTFIGEMVASKVLTSELEPPVTGPSPAEAFAAALSAMQPASADGFARACARLSALDQEPLGANTDTYDAVREALGELLEADHRHLFHGKLYKPADQLSLGPDVLERLAVITTMLERMAAPPGTALAEFARQFSERYETRWVSLHEVLDDDVGIGFGASGREASPLLDGLMIGHASSRAATLSVLDQRLARLWARVANTDQQDLRLDGAALDELTKDLPEAAPLVRTQAFGTMFMLADGTEGESSPEVIFQGTHGPSGAALLGRFCHSDPEIDALVRRHTAAEEAESHVIYAEIAHTPQGRHANVIARPVLRAYEIPYLGRSGAPFDRQILVSDLEVTVRGGRVVLRSVRLGREVVPRLTSAHNASGSSLAIYRFLAALAGQDAAPRAAWSWGQVLPGIAEFLPRVRVDGVVVSLARWSCDGDDVKALQSGDAVARFTAAQHLQRRHRMPRWVTYGVGDQQMVVDFTNCLSVDAFAHAIREQARIALTEVYPPPSRCFARGPEGRYVGEFIAPMVRPAWRPETTARMLARSRSTQRSFGPGSQWLYVRLYSSCAGVDRLLQTVVHPFMLEAERDKSIDRWFFVRYGDPGWHLRLRALGDPSRLQHEVLPRLLDRVHHGRTHTPCWKTEIGTYERELERYGGEIGIDLAEAVFHTDSVHVGRCLTVAASDGQLRWRTTLAGLDVVFRGLGLDLEQRLQLVTQLCTTMAPEFAAPEITERQLSERFRVYRASIESMLGPAASTDLGVGIAGALADHEQALWPIGLQLREHERAGRLDAPLLDIAAALGHMHANRMLRSNARVQEFVMYELLRRHYRAALGRARRAVAGSSRQPLPAAAAGALP